MRWPALLLAVLHHFTGISGQCGVPVGMTRIVGGQNVPTLKYPWYVAFVSRNSPTISVSCGGSIITSRHVLTAAHCFPTSGSPEGLYRVLFELVDHCNHPDVPDSGISKVDINPGYNSRTLVGDIAVVTLERSVSYTPVCLPPRNSMTTGEASIIGFGSTLVKSTYPCVLQEARVNILSKRECARSNLESEYSRIPGTICAGVRSGGVDSCDGDSGGPIQTMGSSGAYTIQGIVSFGEGCARKNLPGVYSQVSAYRDFIDRAVRSLKEDPGNGGGGYISTTVDKPSNSTFPHPSYLLQGLLLGLMRPLIAPDSSSGGGIVPAGADVGSHGSQGPNRPLTPWEIILQEFGLLEHRKPHFYNRNPSSYSRNPFSSNRNQLSSNRNQFSSSRNQLSSNRDQFSSSRNQFSPYWNQFSTNRNQFSPYALTQT